MIHTNQSTSTITLHHFDSMKWKKRLYNLSNKLHRSHNNHHHHHWNAAATSATAMAAATEKFIRHSAPTTNHTGSSATASDDIAIHSEDLTASQFANLTGIKTKRNSQQHSIYYPVNDVYEDSSSSEDEEDENEEEYAHDYHYSSSTTSAASCSSHHRQPAFMRIWDSHFWQQESGHKSLPSTTFMNTIAASTGPTSQPLTRHTSEHGSCSTTGMIQKGRFKIIWGEQENEPMTIKETHCVEWKRKRSGSNSSASLLNNKHG